MTDMFDMVTQMAEPKQEGWRRVEGSDDRAMRRGQFTICQYGNKPNEDYALFGAGPEMLSHGKTYQEMIEEADKRSGNE